MRISLGFIQNRSRYIISLVKRELTFVPFDVRNLTGASFGLTTILFYYYIYCYIGWPSTCARTHMMVHAHPNSLNSGNNAMQSLGTINGSMTTKETTPAISFCLTNLGTSRVRCIDTRVLRPSGSPYYQSHHD